MAEKGKKVGSGQQQSEKRDSRRRVYRVGEINGFVTANWILKSCYSHLGDWGRDKLVDALNGEWKALYIFKGERRFGPKQQPLFSLVSYPLFSVLTQLTLTNSNIFFSFVFRGSLPPGRAFSSVAPLHSSPPALVGCALAVWGPVSSRRLRVVCESDLDCLSVCVCALLVACLPIDYFFSALSTSLKEPLRHRMSGQTRKDRSGGACWETTFFGDAAHSPPTSLPQHASCSCPLVLSVAPWRLAARYSLICLSPRLPGHRGGGRGGGVKYSDTACTATTEWSKKKKSCQWSPCLSPY